MSMPIEHAKVTLNTLRTFKLFENIDLSHQELAHMIGTVRSVVSRHLSHLHKEKTLEKKRKDIVIKDCQKILDYAKKEP